MGLLSVLSNVRVKVITDLRLMEFLPSLHASKYKKNGISPKTITNNFRIYIPLFVLANNVMKNIDYLKIFFKY